MSRFVCAILLLCLCSTYCAAQRHNVENAVYKNVDGPGTKAVKQASPNMNSNSDTRHRLEILSKDLSNVKKDHEATQLDVKADLDAIGEELDGQWGQIERRMATYMKDFKPFENDTKVPKVHTDCKEALRDGWRQSGLYLVSPDGGNPIEVYCDQKSSGGGWTVVQKRQDGQVDFHQSWDEYKRGFGELLDDFWIGNENLHRLTAGGNQTLRVELYQPGHGYAYAEYASFSVGDENQKFRLNVDGYTGINSPGDSLTYHNNQQFSTRDQDNDGSVTHCADIYGAGWWFRDCAEANLNGIYGAASEKGVTWPSWISKTTSIANVKMMIRPRSAAGPKNCEEVYENGGKVSGVYSIYPNGGNVVQVYCEQVLQGGSWTVIQSRLDGSVDFYRGWADYKVGFGSASSEYWVGNDNLHALTADGNQKLLVELKMGGEVAYAYYSKFAIGNETTKYQLTIDGFSDGVNSPGDSLTQNNGLSFTTFDNDGDGWSEGNCGVNHHGAWWYPSCGLSHLNGDYAHIGAYTGIHWNSWREWESLNAVRMMIKSN